jgi:hypothetical protein
LDLLANESAMHLELNSIFIQFCRDYTLSPWSGLADQVFLENLYNAGTAFYTYPGCELIDFGHPPSSLNLEKSHLTALLWCPSSRGFILLPMKPAIYVTN